VSSPELVKLKNAWFMEPHSHTFKVTSAFEKKVKFYKCVLKSLYTIKYFHQLNKQMINLKSLEGPEMRNLKASSDTITAKEERLSSKFSTSHIPKETVKHMKYTNTIHLED
jgi:hypothetical protein